VLLEFLTRSWSGRTLSGRTGRARGIGGQALPRSPVSLVRFRRRSGRLNRLMGEPSCGFTKSLRCLFGGSRKEGAQGCRCAFRRCRRRRRHSLASTGAGAARREPCRRSSPSQGAQTAATPAPGALMDTPGTAKRLGRVYSGCSTLTLGGGSPSERWNSTSSYSSPGDASRHSTVTGVRTSVTGSPGCGGVTTRSRRTEGRDDRRDKFVRLALYLLRGVVVRVGEQPRT
jgi:hypothetical protein